MQFITLITFALLLAIVVYIYNKKYLNFKTKYSDLYNDTLKLQDLYNICSQALETAQKLNKDLVKEQENGYKTFEDLRDQLFKKSYELTEFKIYDHKRDEKYNTEIEGLKLMLDNKDGIIEVLKGRVNRLSADLDYRNKFNAELDNCNDNLRAINTKLHEKVWEYSRTIKELRAEIKRLEIFEAIINNL